MYRHLFRDCFEYFHNSEIILLVSDNFKDKILILSIIIIDENLKIITTNLK